MSGRPFRSHGTSDGGVDRSATAGSISMGQRAPLSAARSRSDLRAGVRFAGEGNGHKQVLSAPRSPWQRAYVERVIGTLRRECLDHVIAFSLDSLCRRLQRFSGYYHRSRTHLGLQKDTPEPRPLQPPGAGRIIAMPEVGGLHHRYERCAVVPEMCVDEKLANTMGYCEPTGPVVVLVPCLGNISRIG